MAPSQAVLLKQVERLHKKSGNQTCAECAQRDSCWASIIPSPIKGGKDTGVFICGRCYKHHSSLGMKYVVVKSLSMATPWTEEEVSIFERTGNDVVNAIFEAKLSEGDRNTLKEIVTTDRKEEAKARLTFITRKYKNLKYFCEKDFKRSSSRQALEEEDDENDDPEEKVRQNRKAMLLGGALSVRQMPSTKQTGDLEQSSNHSTRSMRSSRTQGVLNRAASQRSLAMKKSNSARDLMGRLNNISLGSPPSSNQKESQSISSTESEKQSKMETSSTQTAATEISESSEEQDPPPPKRGVQKSASMDERPSKRNVMVECRQSSLRGLRNSNPGRNLNDLSILSPGRSLSSRNLMQLPSALQVQAATTGPEAAQGPRRKPARAKSMRSLFGGSGNGSTHKWASLKQSDAKADKRTEMRKSMSFRGLRSSNDSAGGGSSGSSRMQRTSSGRNLSAESDGSDKMSQLPGIRKSMSFRTPGRSKSNEGIGDGSPMRRSSSGRNLMKEGMGGGGSSLSSRMQRSSSGRHLVKESLGGGSSLSSRMKRSSSGRNLMKDGLGGGSNNSSCMHRSSSGRNLVSDNLGGGSSHEAKESPRQEQSIVVKDLDTDALSPSRRDLYDPDAKGLALLMQDSEKSPCRSYRSERHDRRDSDIGGSSHSGHGHTEYRGEKSKRGSRPPSHRSSHSERHHRRYSDYGGSSRERSSRKESRHSRSPGNDERSSHGERRDRRDSGTDYMKFYEQVDLFIASVDGDVNDEGFWVRMIEKWVESA